MHFQSEGDDDTKQVKANTQQNEQANDDEAIEVSLRVCSFALFERCGENPFVFLCSVSDMAYTVMCIFEVFKYLPCLYRKVG